MKRPVTPENRPDIHKDGTKCRTTKPVAVRIERPELPTGRRSHGINWNKLQELPAGSEVTVFGAQTLNLTGINEPMCPDNTGYRIEGKLQLTFYDEISRQLDEKTCSNEKLRKHSNLIPVVPPNCDLNEALPAGTVVTIQESTTYNGMVLRQGELFVILSNAKTPKGQNFGFKNPICNALYDVARVNKNVRDFRVRNPSSLLVPHKDLERIPQESS